MALVRYDVSVRDNPDPDKLAVYIVQNLQLKGFCLLDAGATSETCAEAVEEIKEIQPTHLFKPPCEDVLDGLLGRKGSASVYTFDANADFAECPTVGKFDKMASSMGVLLENELPKLGFEVARRSPCMLHEIGVYDKGTSSPMTERMATFWLQQFVWHRLMIIQFLGPTESQLEMSYFAVAVDEDAGADQKIESVKLRCLPGSMVILRPDILGHKVTGDSGSMAMTTWFLPQACNAATRGGTAVSLPPVAQKLDAWSMRRLKQLAEYEISRNYDILPEEWRVVAAAAYKMDAPKELQKGGKSLEMAMKGEVLVGSVEIVDGLKWLKTPATDNDGRFRFGYVLIDGDRAGVGKLIEKVEDLPADWLVAKNHLWTHTDQVCVRALACKFPCGHNIETQFQPYIVGPDFGIEVPMRRWDFNWVYAPPEANDPHRTTCKHGGFMEGLELFDNKKFSVSVAEVISMDPQHRIGLECTDEAFARGGYGKEHLMRSLTGTYVGGGSSEWGYVDNCMKDPAADMFGCTGGSGAIQSNRLAFNLGLMGPSITITCEGASSLLAIERGYTSFGREKLANIRCVAVGIYAQMHFATWPPMTRNGIMWRGGYHGRCKSFDEDANGYIRGDGTGAIVMTALTEKVDNQYVRDPEMQELAIISGAYLMFHGQGASFEAPSGAAEQQIIIETCRMAHHDPVAIDHIDANAEGRIMWDAVEAMSLSKALRKGYEEVPLLVTASKSNSGHGIENCSMVQFMRLVMGSHFGTMAPLLHLSTLNPMIDPEEPSAQFITECMPYKHRQAVYGIRGQSICGTYAFATVTSLINDSHIPPSRPWQAAPERIAFWPGGGGTLDHTALPGRGYEIIGSWDGWESSGEMQESEGSTEGEKIYTYVVTLGVNRFEQFQVLIDGNRRKILHPDRAKAASCTPVCGPDANSLGLNWMIDGRSQLQEELIDKDGPPAALTSGEDGESEALAPLGNLDISGKWLMTDGVTGNTATYSFLHSPGSDRFTGEYTGLQQATITDATISGSTIQFTVHGATNVGQLDPDGRRIRDLKVNFQNEVVATFNGVWQEGLAKEQVRVWTTVETMDSGVPGDRYKISLRVAGRFRAVTWHKLGDGADAVETLEDGSTPEAPQALAPAEPVEDTGTYYVVAGWNMWSFSQKMMKDDGSPGTHYLEVKMLWDGGDFQIVRDGDWSQAFHPEAAGALDGSSVEGPDDYFHGLNYYLNGTAGDVFRIEFQRTFDEGQEIRALSWTLLRHEELEAEERRDSKRASYYLVGSMETGREQKIKMEFDKERWCFYTTFEIGKSGEEYFAILYNGDWNYRIYPNLPDAFPNEENPHRILGPDDLRNDLFWHISEKSGDEDAAGENYEVQLQLDEGGRPAKVEWSRL